MEEMSNHINKQTPKTNFIKLNNIVSIFIFIIFFFSSSVCLSSYTHHFSSFDRHYIFLLCNGILVFLIMNFDSTKSSSPKKNQSVITYETNLPPLLISSAMEEQEQEQEQKQEQEQEQEQEEKIEEDDESIHIGSHVCVVEDDYVVSAAQYQIEDQKAEIHFVVDEQEIEELNRRCAEFHKKDEEKN
ncbi:unnamed protein product [Lactuca virosa]|uniref:Transmembrane protein n=1 Tax=Lactuca virosa TaxID=75947 RepID=A0AAU9P363_9ASTR|nr:unnamed protein product [Lactuca virosa]